MSLKFLVIQHIAWEGPGRHLLAAAKDTDKGTDSELMVWRAWEASMPERAREAAAIVCLGGSPNVDEDARYPYLAPLKDFIRSWVAERRPYLGFCLGHQLLAHVLGCQVGPQRRSIGFTDGRLTEAGLNHPLFRGWPPELRLFKWHGQGVRLPLATGCELLADSDACPVEAFGLAGVPQVVGMQFDLHAANASDAAAWLEADRDWLAQTGPLADPVDAKAIVAEAREREVECARLFRLMWENFCGLVEQA